MSLPEARALGKWQIPWPALIMAVGLGGFCWVVKECFQIYEDRSTQVDHLRQRVECLVIDCLTTEDPTLCRDAIDQFVSEEVEKW